MPAALRRDVMYGSPAAVRGAHDGEDDAEEQVCAAGSVPEELLRAVDVCGRGREEAREAHRLEDVIEGGTARAPLSGWLGGGRETAGWALSLKKVACLPCGCFDSGVIKACGGSSWRMEGECDVEWQALLDHGADPGGGCQAGRHTRSRSCQSVRVPVQCVDASDQCQCNCCRLDVLTRVCSRACACCSIEIMYSSRICRDITHLSCNLPHASTCSR